MGWFMISKTMQVWDIPNKCIYVLHLFNMKGNNNYVSIWIWLYCRAGTVESGNITDTVSSVKRLYSEYWVSIAAPIKCSLHTTVSYSY